MEKNILIKQQNIYNIIMYKEQEECAVYGGNSNVPAKLQHKIDDY